MDPKFIPIGISLATARVALAEETDPNQRLALSQVITSILDENNDEYEQMLGTLSGLTYGMVANLAEEVGVSEEQVLLPVARKYEPNLINGRSPLAVTSVLMPVLKDTEQAPQIAGEIVESFDLAAREGFWHEEARVFLDVIVDLMQQLADEMDMTLLDLNAALFDPINLP